MSERINQRPEIGNALEQFTRLVEMFEAVQGNPSLEQTVTVAILGLLSSIDLDNEELVLVDRNAAPHEVDRPTAPAVKKPIPERRRQEPREQLSLPPIQEENLPRITRGATRFYLCSASESRLLKSLEDTGVVLVNEFLLAKMIGKISVLALETKEGFVAGHWCAPRTKWMRDTIRQAFDKGLSRVSIPNDVWDYMREASVENINPATARLKDPSILSSIRSEQTFVDFAKGMIASLPVNLPPTIYALSRHEYRETHREGK